MKPFSAHGAFAVAAEGQLLVIHTRGPWNREHILEYAAGLTTVTGVLAGAPWSVLAFISEDGMHTPDSFLQMVETIRQQRLNGRCGTAVLLQNVFGESVVRDILSRMYRDAGEPFEFFTDEGMARDWLAERLAQAAPPGP